MQIRRFLGWSLFAIGASFITWNSFLLARGAARWAYSWYEAAAYGSVAATVPWVLAAMPLIIVLSWRPGRRIGRPTIATMVACAMWVVFAVYNLMGAGSAISMVRSDVTADRKHAAGTQRSMESRRKMLEGQMAGIPAGTRPAGQVAALIKAQEASIWWTNHTNQCREVENPKARKFCADYQKLVGELASAKDMARLNSEIAELDQQFATAAPAADVVDPEAVWWAATGWVSVETAQAWLPMKTPLVLELGAMTLWYFSAMLLGFKHTALLGGGEAAGASSSTPPVARRLPPPIPQRPVQNVTRQRELALWFFANCTRPAANGSLSEADWYGHYSDVCARSNDAPLPLDSFRRIARDYVPVVKEMEGKVYFLGILPNMPAKVA